METTRTSAIQVVGAAIALILLALLAAAQIAQTVSARRIDAVDLNGVGNIARGTIVSVFMTNGQMYYGTLVEAGGGLIRLADIYYVRSVAQAPGAPPTNQLVSRNKEDFHSPDWMAIPIDKILFIEGVGKKSRLASLIAEDRAKSAKP